MDELKILENDFVALFEGYPDELSKEMQDRLMKSTIGNFFDYSRLAAFILFVLELKMKFLILFTHSI